MIKAVWGVDPDLKCESALKLLARLNIPDLHLCAATVADTSKAYSVSFDSAHIQQMLDTAEMEAKGILRKAMERMQELGFSGEGKVLAGSRAKALLEFAESYGADVIVAGSERKGRWGSLFMGSVTRALAIHAKESFLVAKGPHEGSERVTTVIATDHSEYCDRSIERLLAWAPEGIGKLTIMTAQWTDISMLEMALKVSNLDPSELHDWIAKRTEAKNRELAQKFEAIGIPCETRVIQAEPREAIEIAMRQAGAELLVIGAQGHGLTDRLTVGSVAMHEVVSSPHSVLVMRA